MWEGQVVYVSDLALDDFRSYEHLVLSLEPGITAFIGPNGQGKTNLVEAIGYLANLSSHRVGADTALVRRAAPGERQPAGAVLRAKVVRGERPSVLELEVIAGRANRARLSRTQVRPRELLGILRTVIFAPEDLSLVREEPGVRRRFLDDLAVMLRPSLAGVRAEHDKILAQRASLLKSARAASRSGGRAARESMLATLEVWDAQLAAAAAQMIAARVEVLARLRPWVESSYAAVSQSSPSAGPGLPATPVHVAYRSSLLAHEGHPDPDPRTSLSGPTPQPHPGALTSPDPGTGEGGGEVSGAVVPGENQPEGQWLAEEAELTDVAAVAARLEAAMASLHDREIERGANLVGAHRDDLALFLHHLPAKGFASHGEQWSLALALRLASYEMLRHDVDAFAGDGEPVLILDDVFASLDDRRRRALSRLVSGAQQVLLTAAVDDDVPPELAGARFRVTGSQVSRE